jgi:hypothetical protein
MLKKRSILQLYESPEPPAIHDEWYPEDSDRYEVDRIIAKRFIRKGRNRTRYLQYLVRWKGYSPMDDWWMDAKDLDRCEELINKFKNKQRTETYIDKDVSF